MSHYPDGEPPARSWWSLFKAWWSSLFWPLNLLSDVQADVFAIRGSVVDSNRKLDDLTRKVIAMGVREDASDARLAELVGLVRDFLGGKDARIAELEAALASADADKAAELAADSDADAAKKEEVAAALEELLNPAPVEDGE